MSDKQPTLGIPGLVTHVEPTTVLGVYNPPPSETCEKRGEPGRKTVTLQVFPRTGRLYLCGVRALYDAEEDADIVFDIQHPLTKDPLLGLKDIPGVALNPENEACWYFFSNFVYEGQVALPISAVHVKGAIEPVYCSESEPLIVVATGTAWVSLMFWGCSRYSVVRYPQPSFGCTPEHLGYFEGAFPHHSIPKLLPKHASDTK
jgi:hypothetical protein